MQNPVCCRKRKARLQTSGRGLSVRHVIKAFVDGSTESLAPSLRGMAAESRAKRTAGPRLALRLSGGFERILGGFENEGIGAEVMPRCTGIASGDAEREDEIERRAA
jgi:hypothetical protein